MRDNKWTKYGKAIIAAAFFLWTIIAPQISGDGTLSGMAEWAVVLTGALNAVLTYIVPLNPNWRGGKTLINAGLASLAAAQTLLDDGLQPDDWTIIIGAGLAILIGWVAPVVSMPETSAEVRVPAGLNA